MQPDELRRIGEAVFGKFWQTALAREIGVADRTVRRTTKPITPEERQKAVEVMADKISNEMLKGATYAGHFDMVLKQQAAALTALEAAGFVVRRG